MILTKSEFISQLTTYLPDNSTQQISPLDLRTVITNLADSIHVLAAEECIVSDNLETPHTRSTIVGKDALHERDKLGRSTYDNSAFGFQALFGNYTGSHNTALGANTLNCNLYGTHNTAVGVQSIVGNTVGSGNVGLGNYTLQTTRTGDFNIAIGHGAGHYIGDKKSYQFYVGAHPVSGDACELPAASAYFTPLLYGDLQKNVLGVNINNVLHDFGKFQVSGDASPWVNHDSNLGHGSRHWALAYLSSGISYADSGNFTIFSDSAKGEAFPDQYDQVPRQHFDSDGNVAFGTIETSGDQGLITVKGNIVPHESRIYSIGWMQDDDNHLMWDGYFNDLVVSGSLHANDVTYNNISECFYECKTLHLATSGFCDPDGLQFHDSAICGFMDDAGLEGAGIETHASGVGYRRDYRFVFRKQDQSIPASVLEQDSAFSRSHWESNISIRLQPGRHLYTDRILADSQFSMVTESGAQGLFIKTLKSLPEESGNFITFGQQANASGEYVGRGNVSFIGASGDYTYDMVVASVDSGVKDNTSLNNAVRLGIDLTAAVSGTNRPRWSLRHYNYGHGDYDRFAIGSEGGDYREYDHTRVFEPITISRSGMNVGISNNERVEDSAPFTPRALFHVQGTDTGPYAGNTIARIGTKTGDTANDSMLEIVGNGEHAGSGVRISYSPSTDYIDFSTLVPSGLDGLPSGFMSVTNNNFVGVGTTLISNSRQFTPNEPLTVCHALAGTSGTISMKEQEKSPGNTAAFGKIYVKPKVAAGQTQALFFMDDAGNEFNVTTNVFDIDNTTTVWTDAYRNTFAGSGTPSTLPTPSTNPDNAGYGAQSLANILTASGNTVMGNRSLRAMTTGDNNTIVGNDNFRYMSGNQNNNVIVGQHNLDSGNSSSTNNIIIGNDNFNSINVAASNSIIIGNAVADNGTNWSNRIEIGHGEDPVIRGQITGSKFITINQADFYVANGKSTVQDTNKSIEYSIIPTTIGGVQYIDAEIKDTFNSTVASGVHRLLFTDSDNTTGVLAEYDFRNGAMGTSPSYADSNNPLMTLHGDLNIRGAINFSDGTSLETFANQVFQASSGLRSTTVSNEATRLTIDFVNLTKATSLIAQDVDLNESYVALGMRDASAGGEDIHGRMSLFELGNYLGSGYASIHENDNHLFAPVRSEANIDTINNSGTIFVGLDVGASATGWTHSVILGTEAGFGATTPNVGFGTDTNAIFIGNRAGYQADNVRDAVYIGTNAGNGASEHAGSIFIGMNAGMSSSVGESIGIGKNALRGLTSSAEGGSGNIEIVANLLDNQRLLYGKMDESNLLNIQNTIAGNTSSKRISIGDAVTGPDAVLMVRKDNSINGHANLDYIQTWWQNSKRVAYVDCSGNFVSTEWPPTIEGFTQSQILAPEGYDLPTSGLFTTKNDLGSNGPQYYLSNRDVTLDIDQDIYVVAQRVNGEYRPIHIACSGTATTTTPAP